MQVIVFACNFAKTLTGHISEAIHHWSLILCVSNTFNIPNMCTKFREFLERVCQKFVEINNMEWIPIFNRLVNMTFE